MVMAVKGPDTNKGCENAAHNPLLVARVLFKSKDQARWGIAFTSNVLDNQGERPVPTSNDWLHAQFKKWALCSEKTVDFALERKVRDSSLWEWRFARCLKSTKLVGNSCIDYTLRTLEQTCLPITTVKLKGHRYAYNYEHRNWFKKYTCHPEIQHHNNEISISNLKRIFLRLNPHRIVYSLK